MQFLLDKLRHNATYHNKKATIIVIELVMEFTELYGLLQHNSRYDVNIYGYLFANNGGLNMTCTEKVLVLTNGLITKNSLC